MRSRRIKRRTPTEPIQPIKPVSANNLNVYSVLGRQGRELCKANANNEQEVIKLLEAERDKTTGQKIMGVPVGKFIYDEWVKSGKKIVEVGHGKR